MSADIFRWRIASTLATLSKGILVRHGIPTPSQSQYRDHSTRTPQGDGGISRHGHNNAEILWTKLSPNQAADLKDLVDAAIAANGLLYATIKPLDGSGVAWMDISGYPDLSDIAPDAPIIGADGYMHSNILLNFNNVTVISTSPSFP